MILEQEIKDIMLRYKLTQDELYRYDNRFLLVNARGIRKIITTEKLNVSKRVEFDSNGGIVVITRVERGSAFTKDYTFYEATGEAKPGLNTTFKYPVAVAESRANGRAVLMSVGLYERGIISEAELEQEVEAEDIIQKRKTQVNTATTSLMDKLKAKAKEKKQ